MAPWTIARSERNESMPKEIKDVKTMNTAIVDRLLSLVAKPFKAELTLKQYSDPNMNFKSHSKSS